MPEIGTKVIYRNCVCGEARECVGIVVKQYYGYKGTNEDGAYEVPDIASVQVGPLPHWWVYPETNTFAPEIRYLTEC